MKILKSSFILFACAATLGLFGSCSRSFSVKPVGRLGGVITFEFYDEARQRFEPNITTFAVVKRGTDGDWRPVWAITGEQRLREVSYGAKYPGLKETKAPARLSAGIRYKVFVMDLPRGGPSGSAAAFFSFAEDGTIILHDSP
jgi:hypothetical protein